MCRLDSIATDDPIPVAADLSPSVLPSPPFLAHSLSPSLPNAPPSSTTQMTSFHPPPLAPAPFPPAFQNTGIPRTAIPISNRLKTTKRDSRSRTIRPNPYKMDYLRLRSEVKWRLKDLGFETHTALPPPPPAPAVSPQPDEVVPILVKIGSIPALLWPASVFNAPPSAPVVPTPRRNYLDYRIGIPTLASLDFPKRAHRPRRRRRRLILGKPEFMEDIEFSGPSP